MERTQSLTFSRFVRPITSVAKFWPHVAVHHTTIRRRYATTYPSFWGRSQQPGSSTNYFCAQSKEPEENQLSPLVVQWHWAYAWCKINLFQCRSPLTKQFNSRRYVFWLMLAQNQATSRSITCGRLFIMMLTWEEPAEKSTLWLRAERSCSTPLWPLRTSSTRCPTFLVRSHKIKIPVMC